MNTSKKVQNLLKVFTKTIDGLDNAINEYYKTEDKNNDKITILTIENVRIREGRDYAERVKEGLVGIFED